MRKLLGCVSLVLFLGCKSQSPVQMSHEQLTPNQAITSVGAMPSLSTPNCEVPKRINPYEIKWWIRNNPACGFQTVLALLQKQEHKLSSYVNEDVHPETQTFDGGPTRPTIVILKLSVESQHLFLFSKGTGHKKAAAWKFIGEVTPAWYGNKWRIVQGNKSTWFVLGEAWSHGSGSGLWGETWYEITSSKLAAVLKFPLRGGEIEGLNLGDLSFDGVVTLSETTLGQTIVKVNFKTKFITPGEYSYGKVQTFFSKSQQATFVRDNVSGEFNLDETRSNLTKEELETVYSPNGLGDANFLKYNSTELTKLASHGSKQQKDILRKILLKLPESEQTKSLLAKLH